MPHSAPSNKTVRVQPYGSKSLTPPLARDGIASRNPHISGRLPSHSQKLPPAPYPGTAFSWLGILGNLPGDPRLHIRKTSPSVQWSLRNARLPTPPLSTGIFHSRPRCQWPRLDSACAALLASQQFLPLLH